MCCAKTSSERSHLSVSCAEYSNQGKGTVCLNLCYGSVIDVDSICIQSTLDQQNERELQDGYWAMQIVTCSNERHHLVGSED